MNHQEFTIVDHGGTFSCIPTQVLVDVRLHESAKRLVARALDEGEVTLKTVDAIAGADKVLGKAVREVIMTLLKNQFDCGADDVWNAEELWEILDARGVVEGAVPEGWQPDEDDLGYIPVVELEWLWAPSALLSTEWSEYLPQEVNELAEFSESLSGESMWFRSEQKSVVVDLLKGRGLHVAE